MRRKPDFETMFHPKSLAVIGASSGNGSGLNFITSCQEQGFKGNIYPVNPKASEILGLKAYPTIGAIPEKVEYVIVSVPARIVPQILKECADAGAVNIHIFTAGFKETDQNEGVELEKKIREIAEERGLAIVGPNGMGLYVPESGLVSWRRAPKESGPVGVISQSGTIAQFISSSANGTGFRFSKVISFGNGTVLDSTDYLEYFRDDPKTQIIAMYLEGIGDGRRLTELVREVNPRKPVIVLKGGLTESGARAVASHTGSLAGSEAIWSAFFKQTGAVRAETLEELVDLIVAFSYMIPMNGRRIAVLGGGGGTSVASADALAREGLETPTLGEETQRQLRPFVPEAGTSIRNPLDMGIVYRTPTLLEKTLNIVGADSRTDAYLLNFSMNLVVGQQDRAHGHDTHIDTARLSEFARENPYRKPLAIVMGSLGYDEEVEKGKLRFQTRLLKAKIATFPSVHRAARALSKFAQYYENLNA